MKLTLAVLLLVAFGCGKYTQPTTGKVGELRSINPVAMDGLEVSKLTSLCQVLQQKAGNLPGIVNSAYSFDFSETPCGSTDTSSSTTSVVLSNTVAGYKFLKNDGSYFFFPDVETHSSGTMGTICSNLNTATNPITVDGGFLYVSTENISTTDCNAASNEMCIYLQRGAPKNGQARIHTKEWIKFKMRDDRLGFFTMRKIMSQADCKDGDVRTRKATLR